jgi:hypothetical protein
MDPFLPDEADYADNLFDAILRLAHRPCTETQDYAYW